MNADNENDLGRIKECAEKLGEHFDSVHIFCTRHEPTTDNGTLCFSWGSGNWFARKGQIEEWIEQEKESTKIKVRKDEE